MEYTALQLYKQVGQYDYVCSVTFVKDSEAYKTYGPDITGDFFYNKNERKDFQDRLDNNDSKDEHGNVKFFERLRRVSDASRKELISQGFSTRDISSVLFWPREKINEYVAKELRALPKPIVVEFDATGFNPVKSFLWLYEQRRSSGYKLTPFEEEEDVAYKIMDNNYTPPNNIPKELYQESGTDNIKASLRFRLLNHKFLYADLTAEQDSEFKELIKQRSKERVEILFKELEKSTEQLKKVGIDYRETIQILSGLISFFEPERLSHSKYPVWWDLERFLHIFIRHVTETKIGERNVDRSEFQYKLKDIKDLIKIILDGLSDEIDAHFEKYPDKDFKRHGSMSVYYNGDYYAIHIRADGLLMAFYKNE